MASNNRRPGMRNAYTYKHISREQGLTLEDVRTATDQLDNSYSGYLLLTQSEYCMLIPLFSPIAILWNVQLYNRMCRIIDHKEDVRDAMKRNLLFLSLMSLIPIVNIIFSRRFKCSTRNLHLVEKQLEAEENKVIYRQSTAGHDAPLPENVRRMFSKYPVFKRDQYKPENSRVSFISVYHSTRTSFADLTALNDHSSKTEFHKSSESLCSTVIDINNDQDSIYPTTTTAADTEKSLSYIKLARANEIKTPEPVASIFSSLWSNTASRAGVV